MESWIWTDLQHARVEGGGVGWEEGGGGGLGVGGAATQESTINSPSPERKTIVVGEPKTQANT